MNLISGGKEIDRWLLAPGFLALVTVGALALICQLPGMVGFIMVPLSMLGCAIGSITVLATTVFLITKRRPRRGASIFFVFLLPVLLWRPIVWGADLVHLGLTVGLGIGQLGVVSSQSSNSGFAAYDWSVGLAGSSTILIHDISDEIALPAAQHTKPLSFEDGFGEECAGRVQHLVTHYYVCSF